MGHRSDTALQSLFRRRQIACVPQRLRRDRLNGGESVLDAMVQLVQEQPLRLLSLLSFGEIPACSGDRNCLPTRAVSFKFDETPGAEPSPTAIGLFDPVFHFVAAVA